MHAELGFVTYKQVCLIGSIVFDTFFIQSYIFKIAGILVGGNVVSRILNGVGFIVGGGVIEARYDLQ